MQCKQAACPHCGSTLTFGGDVAVGSQVDCLICMRPFIVQASIKPIAAVSAGPAPHRQRTPGNDTKKLGQADTKSISKAPTKPALPKANPTPAPKTIVVAPVPPARQSRVGLIVAGIVVFVAVIGSVNVAVWKFVLAKTDAPGEPNINAVAVVKPAELPAEPEKVIELPPPAKVATKEEIKKPAPIEPTDDDTPKPKAKIVLTRKDVKKLAAVEPGPKEVAFSPPPPQYKVFGLSHDKIQETIKKGLDYVVKTQGTDGSWEGGGYPVGYAAIGGLVMLECNLPPDHSAVVKAANFVRGHIAKLDFTYEMSLALLFLDRLGDPSDRVRIQGLALRLLAMQDEGGGWPYFSKELDRNNRQLDAREMYQLYSFLVAANKRAPDDLPRVQDKKEDASKTLVAPNPDNPADPFQQLYQLMSEGAPAPPLSETKKIESKSPPGKGKGKERNASTRPGLKDLPIVQLQGKKKDQIKLGEGPGDNSNTQFALLALWAARRHDVPTDQAILLAYQRFVNSMDEDGGWRYYPRRGEKVTATMTCVGLLGMAMGHGAAPEWMTDPKNPKDNVIKPALHDPNIQRALSFLANSVGEPTMTKEIIPLGNLYLLWSIERVAVLYDLKAIEGKDWYCWGAQMLVQNQTAEGAWRSNVYHGATNHINTCFAVLFLKRSNLVKDLTNNLRLQTGISATDP